MYENRSTVLLVDDHPLLRKGVSQLLDLEDDIEVIGEAAGPARCRCRFTHRGVHGVR